MESVVETYRKLDPKEIVSTSTTLKNRVHERFPSSGLSKVSAELEHVAQRAVEVSEEILRPNWGLRAVITVAIVAIALLVATAISKANVRHDLGGISDFIQGTEAMAQNVAFAGATVYFLISLEIRRKRARVLRALHVLRSLAHIVDMHQLTKDPERVINTDADTSSSPKRMLSPFELTRYLNYCSEMLALISKIAAIYVQDFHDADAVDAASDIEDLTVGLSRSIWQKITLLNRLSLA